MSALMLMVLPRDILWTCLQGSSKKNTSAITWWNLAVKSGFGEKTAKDGDGESGWKHRRNRLPGQITTLRLKLHLVWPGRLRSEEHTSELQSLMRISYAVFALKKKHKP